MAYLLPCTSCERKLVVTTGEAGGQVRCQCGAEVAVPTVRGLRELNEVSTEKAVRSEWTARHSVVFLGLVVAIAGLTFAIYMHFQAAEARPNTSFADDIRTMPPADTWNLWSDYFRRGIGNWKPVKGVQQQTAIRTYAELKRWELIGFGIAGLGVVLAIVGVTMLGPHKPSSVKRPPRRPVASALRK